MAKKKTREMTKEALELVAVRFKVLSEPLRLGLLQTLEDGERSVNELAEAMGVAQPSVSKHLKMLQEAGFVGRRQEGNVVYYSIADPMVFELCTLMCDSLQRRLAAQAGAFAAARRN